MNSANFNNISTAFNQPKIFGSPMNFSKPMMMNPHPASFPTAQLPQQMPTFQHMRPAAQANPQQNQNGFSLINFSKGSIIRDSSIYHDNFRYKTRDALKGTLKNYAERETVAKLLWDKRGGGGVTKDEVKFGLRKLEAQGKLNTDQVRAVRKKMGIY